MADQIKIALVGSAPSSIALGPYDDPSWQIWACSPGAYGVARRTDVFFELHRWQPPTPGKPGTGDPWFSPEYCMWLSQHPCVWVADPAAQRDLRNARMLPSSELVAKYGPYFFTSSLSWMFAMALESGATTIGMWGVDMAATEEWGYQRAGCQYFVQLARSRGIEVVVPLESDLLVPPPLYGVCETDHAWIKMQARRKELEYRMARLAEQDTSTKAEYMFVKGALDDMAYMQNTWVGLPAPTAPPPVVYPPAPGISMIGGEPVEVFGGAATLGPLPPPLHDDATVKRVPRKRKNGDARGRAG